MAVDARLLASTVKPNQITTNSPLQTLMLGREEGRQNRQLDQRDRQIDQGDRRIDLAAEQMGLSREEFGMQILGESVANARDSEQAIQLAEFYSKKPLPEEMKAQLRGLPAEAFGAKLKGPAGIQEFQNLVETGGLNEEEAAQAARVKLRLDSPAATASPRVVMIGEVPHTFDPTTKTMVPVDVAGQQITADTVGGNKRTVSRQTELGKDEAGRLGDFITEGMLAADSMAPILRAQTLLDSVETGGVLNQAQLDAAKALGVEDPNAGELSNLLGKAVLSQLRATFGAAFTAQEGKQLQDIEASFGTNPETNKRLLNNALAIARRSAERGLSAAEEAGDTFSQQKIQEAMNFRLEQPPVQLDRAALQAEARKRGLID